MEQDKYMATVLFGGKQSSNECIKTVYRLDTL